MVGAQHDTELIAQDACLPQADPLLAWGQPASHEDAALVPKAHGPVQFSKHPVCEQDVLLGQMHDPACPKANPIPASSRTIETIASLFI